MKVNQMETEVKGHMSHRKGKRFYVRPHEMHINERVHERHEHRLEEEAEALKHEMHKKHKRYSSPIVDYWRKTQMEEAEDRKHLKERTKRHRKLVRV